MSEPETGAPDAGAATADDAALIAAVQEAQDASNDNGTNSDPPPEHTKPDTPSSKKEKKAPKAEPPANDNADEEIPPLAEVLERRVEKQRHREELQSLRQEAERARYEVQQQLAEAKQAREEAARELQRIQALKADPIRAIKELGWDTQDLVNRVVQEGTPEWQMLSKHEQAAQRLEQKIAEMEAWKAEQQQYREQQLAYQRQLQQQQVYDTFTNIARESTPELWSYAEKAVKNPEVRLLGYTDPAKLLCALGDNVANEYKARTGQVASLADIAQYLAYQAKSGGLGQATQSKANGATQSRANGSRTLSAQAASERRSAPKPYHELDEREQDEALKEAVLEAMRDAG